MFKFNITNKTILFISIVPPVWAVLSQHIHITTGPIALVYASFFVILGNKISNSLKVMCSLCAGIPLAILVMLTKDLTSHHLLNEFMALSILGAMIISLCSYTWFGNFLDQNAWLGGWAIAIYCLSKVEKTEYLSISIQLFVAILVGIFVIGVGNLLFINKAKTN